MIEAYLDESGLDGRHPVVCVGGYAAGRDQWAAFEQSWRLQLSGAGVRCFHARDPACRRLWKEMVEHIREYGLTGALATVPAEAYKRLMGDRPKSMLGNAYSACALGCATSIARRAERESLGPVAFVIEDGQPNVQFVRRTLEFTIGDPDFNVASVTVARKQDFLPLQAADFLAHCAGSYERVWLEKLIGDGPGQATHGHLEDDILSSVSAHLEEIARRNRHRKRQAKLAARTSRGPDRSYLSVR